MSFITLCRSILDIERQWLAFGSLLTTYKANIIFWSCSDMSLVDIGLRLQSSHQAKLGFSNSLVPTIFIICFNKKIINDESRHIWSDRQVPDDHLFPFSSALKTLGYWPKSHAVFKTIRRLDKETFEDVKK